ncbi:MAG: hypothetical protein A2W11_06585 [Ignavibacteria bacterium RBG_16_35_7]|nr:MAG: hypothetical protein A2W11_06585 [Ignavibacteria bacterium RBG_16_35_7]
MFIGHLGAGFAAKSVDKKISLGTLFLASQFIDLLWPILLLLGLESVKIESGDTVVTPLNFISYPISHSMLGVIFWGILFGIVYYLGKKNLRGSILLGALVFSHWLLDLLTHRPDLQLFPWSDYKVGLGLWNSFLGTVIVEGLIFALGVFIFYKVCNLQSKSKIILFWSLVIFLAAVYVMNLFGPPPPSEEPIAIVGLSQWLLIA